MPASTDGATPAPLAAPSAANPEPEIVIVGAGMAGICMGIALKRAGIESFVICEQSAGVGGTWWDNDYPGAQCDVPSHLYSFSFYPKPDWSRVFAPSPEIRDYVAACARDHDLGPHLRLGVRITSAAYDEATARWHLQRADGERMSPRFFVLSLGPLNHPRYPAGSETFRGPVMHTARWDHCYDFAGKHVAVIGSAASAIQVVPRLAASAARVTVYQRTPSWIIARPDRAYTSLEKRLFRLKPVSRAYRAWLYWTFEIRYAAFKGRGFWYRVLRRMATSHLRAQVSDPALRDALRPSYPIGCKRILISNEYYPALAQRNVELVPAAAVRFTPDGVVAADGSTRQADVVVCATGFDTITPLADLPVRGAGAATLAAAWRDGPEAYRGVAVAGFPNLFMLLGPNTATGHTSVLIPIEAQADYIVACLRETRRRDANAIEVRKDAMDRHNEALQRRLARTVWASPACTSWYKTAAGKVLAVYPGFITRYALEMHRPRFGDYRFWPPPAASA